MRCLRERHLHVPASAFNRLSTKRSRCSERHQMPCRVVKNLHRHRLRRLGSLCFRVGKMCIRDRSQHVHGTDNARCLIALALMTGQIGRPGTGLHPLRGQNNVQGASDAGLIPMMYPDYQLSLIHI